MKNFTNNLSKAMGIEVPVVYSYSNLADKDIINVLRKELKGLPLVYCIHRDNTTDLYIGSTIEPEIRFYNHLILGKDSNEYLQNAFNKYGKENFSLYILNLVEIPSESSRKDKENLMIAFEQLYFDLLNPSYNFIKQAGRNRLGISHTEESKKLMSKNRKGKNLGSIPVNKGVSLSDEEKALSINASQHRYKPVYFYDENNNLVTIYKSLNSACRAEKASKSTISNCIKTGDSFRGWTVTYTIINN